MDKAIKLVEWGENSGATWLHIYTTKETHMGLSKFPEGSGGGVEISIYHPSEDDLLCIIKGATEGLMKLHEYNAAKGE